MSQVNTKQMASLVERLQCSVFGASPVVSVLNSASRQAVSGLEREPPSPMGGGETCSDGEPMAYVLLLFF